ncbi:hypothetical protein ACG7TL_003234 [Trametes sanguinea]
MVFGNQLNLHLKGIEDTGPRKANLALRSIIYILLKTFQLWRDIE